MVNRIIGILVVVALGILVSPVLVGHYDRSLKTEMVEAPPFPSPQAQKATIEALGEKRAMLADKRKVGKTGLSELAAVSKVAKQKGPASRASAWIIQLGASKDKVSALRLVNELRAKGYKAFIHQKGAGETFGEEVNVLIGPELKRNSAEMLALQLAKETKLSATVKVYKPLAA